MDINNRDSYYNAIYKANVINTDSSQDPNGTDRIQIYVPYLHYQNITEYENYIADNNKVSNDNRLLFPWAVTLIDDLHVGDEVYCSFINNEGDNFIILGIANGILSSDATASNGSSFSGSASGILAKTMPIIMLNEVGIALGDYPDNIADSKFTKINPADNGGWSIGLIQWHEPRAYDCMFQICKSGDAEVTNLMNTYAKTTSLFADLKESVAKDSSSPNRNKYQSSFVPSYGSDIYNKIYTVLATKASREVQIKYAQQDTLDTLNHLMGEPYNISNPAVLIFLADILNQYGLYLNTTKAQASKICASNKDTMGALNDFKLWCSRNLGSYYSYENRRNTTYNYIKQLYDRGELSSTLLFGDGIDISDLDGKLLHPVPTCPTITSKFGPRSYWNNGQLVSDVHSGIDLSNGNALGEPIIAAHPGKVIATTGHWSYGKFTQLQSTERAELMTCYAHQNEQLVSVGDEVKAGQVIGYVGSTGNSTGPHLHFEVRINGKVQNPEPYIISAQETAERLTKKAVADKLANDTSSVQLVSNITNWFKRVAQDTYNNITGGKLG